MSDKEENDSDEKETPHINEDVSSKNPETLVEGYVPLDSNKNNENSSIISENMPRSETKEGSGENAGSVVQDNSELDVPLDSIKNSSIITENMPRSEAMEGSGDNAGSVVQDNSELDVPLDSNKNTENSSIISENMPRSEAIESSGDNAGSIVQDNSELDKIEAELTEMSKELIHTDASKGSGDYITKALVSDIDDEIIEDTNTETNDTTSNTNVTAVNDGNNDDLDKCDDLELKKADNTDEIEDEDMELRWDEDDASSHPVGDDHKNIGDRNNSVLSEDQLLEDSSDILTEEANAERVTVKDTPKESGNTLKLDIETDKADHEKSLEDELLDEPGINTEAIKSPEMVLPAEESMDPGSIHLIKEKILEDTKINKELEVSAQDKEMIDVNSIDELIKETESSASSFHKEITITEEIKEDLNDIIDEVQLLVKPEGITDKLKSSNNDEDLLKEPDFKDESSEIMSVKDLGKSDNIPEKEISISKGLDDILLEEKLLEESEAAEAIPKSDVTMEVDDEIEEELLKDDEGQNDSCTPMDTDSSIADQAKIENKIIDQPMDDESEVGEKEIALPEVDQTNLETSDINPTTDEIKVMDESDAQSQITEQIIDQPEDTTKEVIKDIHVEERSETVEINKVTAIEDDTKITEENIDQPLSEIENVNQLMNDEKKLDENSEAELIAETITVEESIKTPERALIVSNIEIEGQEKSVPYTTTIEKEIESKKDQEQPKLNVELEHEYINIEEPAVPDTSLEKSNVSEKISPRSSIFRNSLSPIKSFHGLNKPDVMLEIPSQELIDMDMTDLSLNLDQSEVLQSIKKEVDEDVVDKAIAEDDTVSEISVDNVTKVVDDTANQKTVDQDAIVTETNTGKITTENDKSVDQQSTAAEATEDEVQIESKIVESEKKDEAAVEATIEEYMEKMFADDEQEVAKEVPECAASTSQTLEQPSTSTTQMTPDTSDEVPEVSDSLGLLAESAGRMMEDDEEGDDDDDGDGDGDDDDDFDQDESSNQVSAEQSEDSNQAALESEPVTEAEDKELETPEPKEGEFPFLRKSTSQDDVEKMDIEYGPVELQAEIINEMTEEAKSAVDALLMADNPINEETAKVPEETPEEMDVETFKLSDTSDNEADVASTTTATVGETVAESSKETEEKQKQSPSKSPLSKTSTSNLSHNQAHSTLVQLLSKQSPSKMKNLAIATPPARSVVNIVDLEESSSSDDDIQETEVQKQPLSEPETTANDKPASPEPDSTVTSVNIPTGIDIMSTSGGNTSQITTKDGEAVISGVPKPPPHKPARLNTSEVSIKTVSSTEPMVIPESKINEQTSTQSKSKLSLEIFSLDSDEEDGSAKEKSTTPPPHETLVSELEKARETSKCINICCTSDNTVPCRVAESAEVAYYDASRKKRALVCQPCAAVVADRTKNLIEGIKNLTPLFDLDMRKLSQELVEISDSESEDEDMNSEEPKETIGKEGAKIIEDSLTLFLNDTWKKYNMDERLKETQIMIDDEIEKLEHDSKEIDAMLNACQVATDKLRCDLYATFECRLQQLPPLVIQDTPEMKFIGQEDPGIPPTVCEPASTRQAKRRLSSAISETPAKRPAIPLGYAPLDSPDAKEKSAIPGPDTKLDDDKDISVVKLSAEAAPADLPPPGEISRPPLRVGMPVYAMKNAFGPWLSGKVLEMQPKNPSAGTPYTLCRVRFDHKPKSNGKVLQARSVAYSEPADVRMTIGTRLIALFKDSNKRESYYSGVVAEIPNPVNNYRYLVFFDDGYAQYVQHQFTRLVSESSALVWEEVHPFSRDFVREYLMAYPERPMVRLHTGQHLKTEWNGKWWASRVTRVDASLAQVMFVEDGRREWVYRGSTRLAPLYLELRAAERHRVRPMPRSKAQPRLNMPYVEYIRSDAQEPSKPIEAQAQVQQQVQRQQLQRDEEFRRQRAVAKKSTSAPPQSFPPSQQVMPPPNTDSFSSRVVYYTPKNAVKPLKMVPHKCTPKCKRSDVLSLKELRTYNPLAKPLLSGWERQIVRFKGHKDVMYRAPCGRRIRSMRELHHYLRAIDSDLPVDLFDFHYSTHCLAEFVLSKCLVGKKDLSHGKENVPVPCVNYYDDSLPEFCSYNTERTPTAGVPLNLEPEFLCGCDCTDDCQDKSKCACWKMTLEGARTIGLVGPNVGYAYKRLPEPLPSGIYECNSRCKCKHTCLNRVAQHPLQLKLQVFKTPNRGWGIRALNDVPKGSFLCVYAGNLLTDATANLDGLNEGDEYLAELDYIEVVEQMKEGYEEDIPEADKKLDKKEQRKDGEESDEEPSSPSEDEETGSKTDKEDDDFRPGYIGLGTGVSEFNKRLRKREKSKKDEENEPTEDKEKETTKDVKEPKEANAEEDCITISDDEEVREPSRFMAQANMGANEYISKYKSVRTLFGKDEACYIMDAKVQGNIGRYLNHSCCPNVFVQNVFVDTHDPRFPWVAFFALSHIKAGTELTWNYNYDVGSVPGKVLYCYCGAANCRGRLL